MNNLVIDIEKVTQENNYFRRVITTTNHMKIILMSIPPGHEIGMVVYPYTDQFIRIENGEGVAILGNERYDIYDGVSVTVPAGTYHNIINTSAMYGENEIVTN